MTQNGQASVHVQINKNDDSVIAPARARGFANGFLHGNLWDVLLW